MKKQLLAVCDEDAAYAARFADYISRHSRFPVEIHVFSGAEAFLADPAAPKMDAVIAEERIGRAVAEHLPSDRLILLGPDPAEDGTSGEPVRIFKYQKAEGILTAVEARLSMDPGGGLLALRPSSQVIGVCSPAGGCGCTVFALAAAQILGSRFPTVLLSLDLPGPSGILYPEGAEGDLADLIYAVREGSHEILSGLLQSAGAVGNCTVLPPLRRAQELPEIAEEEWRALIRILREESRFERVILDLGILPLICPGVTALCDRIYLPVRSDAVFREKERLFREECLPDAEPVRRVELSGLRIPEEEGRFVEELPWSELGQKVRALLEEEEP